MKKNRVLQRQNVLLVHFVCIAQRVTGHRVNSNEKGFYNVSFRENKVTKTFGSKDNIKEDYDSWEDFLE